MEANELYSVHEAKRDNNGYMGVSRDMLSPVQG